jgi:AbrB family looped-hinge helix DNA binding protein
MMATVENSALSENGQTTIPVSVRRLLQIEPGDSILYEIKGKQVTLRKALKIDFHWAAALESTLVEWQGDTDDDL